MAVGIFPIFGFGDVECSSLQARKCSPTRFRGVGLGEGGAAEGRLASGSQEVTAFSVGNAEPLLSFLYNGVPPERLVV